VAVTPELFFEVFADEADFTLSFTVLLQLPYFVFWFLVL
jgi:hypothetical protein